ncbi:hypothetical protein F5887DRAFT_1191862 [Amanita rubescens]|nr:hypothetical protein F5887DRAFT_1191862 [Amanita rubescens]
MVNVYLRIKDRQVLALSIPFNDIERLSVRPVKWLRFVTFAICGVRGHLSATPNGPPVDYDSISLENIAEAYYYTPEGDYHFVDHNVMDDRITSSEQTACASRFRRNVMARDGPMCYIAVVLQDRLNSYDPALEPGDLGINSVENGIFLNKTLHSFSGKGRSAFLKTPNFALDPADIPRVEAGPMPSSRITLHHLEPDLSHNPMPQRDAWMTGTGISPPSTVTLDYMYGVAAYQRWGTGQDINEVMQQRFADRYKSIPIPAASPYSSDGYSSSEPDDPDDDYTPNRQPRGRNHSTKMSDGMLRAMDNVLALSMLIKGTTPEFMAAERQRREEAEELRAKEAGRVKVQQWMEGSPCVLS